MKRIYIVIVLFSILIIGCSTKSEHDVEQNNAYNLNTTHQDNVTNKNDVDESKQALSTKDDDHAEEKFNAIEDNNETSLNEKDSSKSQQDGYNLDIFPDQVGYGWRYNGSYEYGRFESVVKTAVEENIKYIIVQGEEEDMSGGESGKDFSFKKTYKIMEDGIMIHHEGAPEYMDNTEFYLLKRPIRVGAIWEHPWYEGSMARSQIIEASDNRIIVQTERLDKLEDASIIKSKITIEPDIGIVLEEKVLFKDIDFVERLDYHRQNLVDWMGYYILKSSEEEISGYLDVQSVNDNHIEFRLNIIKGNQAESLTNIAKISGNLAVFEGIIQLGEGEDSKKPIKATFELSDNQIRVMTEGITLQNNGSQVSFDGVYIKQQ